MNLTTLGLQNPEYESVHKIMHLFTIIRDKPQRTTLWNAELVYVIEVIG